jgi:hypothetical protein
LSITPTTPEDYNNAISKLRATLPVANKEWLGLIGRTSNGETIFLPGSYEKGYTDSLLPSSQRPDYAWNLLFIGQLSDGSIVFPPSYDNGRSHGMNDLRFALLAEGEIRLARETHQIKDDLARANATLAKLQEELSRLKADSQQQSDQSRTI